MNSISLPKSLGGCSIDKINVKESVTITEICEQKARNASISESRIGKTCLFNLLV